MKIIFYRVSEASELIFNPYVIKIIATEPLFIGK